jgi:uncharacterized protein YjbI with pentapeptide repeats
MANEEHLALLHQGVWDWNKWRKTDREIKPDLSEANLFRVNLFGANLSEANLFRVNLIKANLSEANLSKADLSFATLMSTDFFGANLTGANLTGATLFGADLSKADLSFANLIMIDLSGLKLTKAKLFGTDLREANLIEANLTGANLIRANLSKADLRGANLSGVNLSETNLSKADLRGANLSGVNLSETKLTGANLIRANLSGVNLSETNLSRIQALETNFEGATFTGACIQDWNINSQTNLNHVICDHVYLKEGKQERRPHDPNKNFAPGEFTKLFQKALETVDLIFSEGIDWQAFLASFQKLQVECGSDELAIQAIEKKSGGAFIIRVEVPPDADKAEVEKYLKREYEIQLKDIEARYRLELNAKDKEIEIYKQQSADILELAKLAASRPINISQNQENNNAMTSISQSHSGSGDNVARDKNITNNYNSQNLAEAAAEIQKLLKQLEESNPTATVEQQQAFVDVAVSPTLKAKFVSALQAGWKEAIKELLDNPYVNVGVAILEGWQEAE